MIERGLTMQHETEIRRRVRERMRNVLDPCSCMTDSPVNIVELGLVEAIEVRDSTVDIRLVPTTPMCTYMTQIIEDVQNTVGQLEGIDEVSVTQNLEIVWGPDRMSDELQSEWQAKKPTMERPSPPAESG